MSDISKLNKYFLSVPPHMPCGCESGRLFRDCHLKNGNAVIRPQKFSTGQILTNNQHKKCYLSWTWNCGHSITREHILSKTVIKQIAKKYFDVRNGNETRRYAVDSQKFVVKRLCDRHNRAFNGIDSEAGRFMAAIQRINSELKDVSNANLRLYIFNVFDLERWLLKTLFNVYFSRLSVNPNDVILPIEISHAFFNGFQKPYGLYMQIKTIEGERLGLTIRPEAEFNLIVEGNSIVGLVFGFAGVELKLLAAGNQHRVSKFAQSHVYRPKTINFHYRKEVMTIAMPWEDANAPDVWLARQDSDPSMQYDSEQLSAPYLIKAGK